MQPTKPDELALMRRVLAHPKGWLRDGDSDDLVETTKRDEYVLAKWEKRGWWDSGVSTRSGWLTPAGRAHFESVIAKESE